MLTQQSFEVHASAIKENTKPDSFGYLIVNVTYTMVTANYQYPAIPITNYNTTFVFGPNSRDIMLKDAETMLTSGLYLPDRFSSLKEALKNKSELSNLPNSNYYPGLVCTSPAVDKGLILPLLTSMDNTFLPIPSESLIDLIKQAIVTGNPFSLKGGKINYITYMDAGLPKAQHETSTSKSPVKESAKAVKASAFKAKDQRQESKKMEPINIWLSAGIGVGKDKTLLRESRLNNIIDLINEKELDRKAKGQDSLFCIKSKYHVNSDKDSDLKTSYTSSIEDFKRLSFVKVIDALCLVNPLLTQIDPLDMNLIMRAATCCIPIHIITDDISSSYIQLPQLKKINPHLYSEVNIAYLKAAEYTKVYLHPDAFDFVMRVKKK